MQSFFRFLIVLCLLIVSFVGGWFSSDWVKQDPFLSNMLNIKTDQYDRFIRDITNVIQETRVMDQNQLIEAFIEQQEIPSFSHLREIDSGINSNYFNEEYTENHDEEMPEEVPIARDYKTEATTTIDPNDMLGSIVQQMSTKEKLSFLLWARSRFTDDQIKQLEVLLQNGISSDNFLTLYQFTRKSLKSSDYEYLLSFVDRYLTLMEHQDRDDAIPVFQANDRPRSN